MDTLIPEVISAQTITTKYNIDDTWWEQFLQTSNNLTSTTVVKDVMSDTECGEMETMVVKAIREICKLKTDAYGFRAYQDGKKMNWQQLENTVFLQPPGLGESLEDWAKRIFEDKKFGLIINSGEKFSSELAQRLAIYASPLLKKMGIPLNGLHTTIFIGNYGKTPLGIHQDHTGANVIHFHLGPGGKIMYNWEEGLFKQLLNGREKADVPLEELLPHAKDYPFNRGDIYFMPWNQFHIGQSDEFSVGVTLWFDNHTRRRVLSNIFDSWKLQYVDMEDMNIIMPEKSMHELHGFQDISAVLKMDERLKQKTFPEFLKTVYEELMYSLFSNAGWSTCPLSLTQEFAYDEDNYENLDNKIVQLLHPFRILYRHVEEEGKLHLFARGSKIEFNYHPEIVALVDKLNEGEALDISHIAHEIFSEMPKEVALYILSLLYNRRSITIVAPHESDPD